MEVYKSRIKINLIYNLMKYGHMEEAEINRYNENIDRIVDQICNFSSDKILDMDSERTELLRKKLGLYNGGKEQMTHSIAVEKKVTDKRIRDSINKTIRDLKYAAYYNILTPEEYASQSDKISNTFIGTSDRLSIKTKNALFRSGFNTIQDITFHTERDFLKLNCVGKQGIEDIKNMLHFYGLCLADEISKDEIPIEVPDNLEDKSGKELLLTLKELIIEKNQLQERLNILEDKIQELESKVKSNE